MVLASTHIYSRIPKNTPALISSPLSFQDIPGRKLPAFQDTNLCVHHDMDRHPNLTPISLRLSWHVRRPCKTLRKPCPKVSFEDSVPSPHLFSIYFAILVQQVFFTFVKTSIVCPFLVPVMDHPADQTILPLRSLSGQALLPTLSLPFSFDSKMSFQFGPQKKGRLANVPQSCCGTDKKN